MSRLSFRRKSAGTPLESFRCKCIGFARSVRAVKVLAYLDYGLNRKGRYELAKRLETVIGATRIEFAKGEHGLQPDYVEFYVPSREILPGQSLAGRVALIEGIRSVEYKVTARNSGMGQGSGEPKKVLSVRAERLKDNGKAIAKLETANRRIKSFGEAIDREVILLDCLIRGTISNGVYAAIPHKLDIDKILEIAFTQYGGQCFVDGEPFEIPPTILAEFHSLTSHGKDNTLFASAEFWEHLANWERSEGDKLSESESEATRRLVEWRTNAERSERSETITANATPIPLKEWSKGNPIPKANGQTKDGTCPIGY